LCALLACFISLQAADFCLTWALLAGGYRRDVYEANPLANRILGNFGWVGLAAFKSACSFVALSAILLVWRYRAAAGVRLLVTLCLVMGGVVGYSGALLAAPEPKEDDAVLRALAAEAQSLSNAIAAIGRLDRDRAVICRDLLEERINLPVAVEQMRTCLDRYAPLMRPSNSGDVPESGDDNALVGYLYYHTTRLYFRDSSIAPKLIRLADDTSERFPSAVLFDARSMPPHARPNFRTGGVLVRAGNGAAG
jgi:hypothetical protein